MEITYKKTKDLIPYEKNPRKNNEAVPYVMESIKEFGFKIPIVIDKESLNTRCAEIPYFFFEQDYDILCYCESENGLLVNIIPILRDEKSENWETYKYISRLEQQRWEWVKKDERAIKIVKNIYNSSSKNSNDSSGVFWVEGTPGEEILVSSEDEKLQEELDIYFNKNMKFNSELAETITGMQTKGFDYIYAYKGEEGRFKFENANCMGVVEVEGRFTEDGKDHVIYK